MIKYYCDCCINAGIWKEIESPTHIVQDAKTGKGLLLCDDCFTSLINDWYLMDERLPEYQTYVRQANKATVQDIIMRLNKPKEGPPNMDGLGIKH